MFVMFARASVKTPKNQQGLVLLVLFIIIALALISYSLSDLSIVQVRMDQKKNTQMALKKAKQALINYALVEADIDAARSGKFGFLPCPDYTDGGVNDEGIQDGNCGARNVSIVGLLPNSTLGLPRLRDSSGSCLLYAVSGAYKQSPETDMLNEDTNGQFQVVDDTVTIIEGVLPKDRIVAIVFAPGKVVAGQARTFAADSYCGRDYGNEAEYLEGDGITDNAVLNAAADSIDQFIHATLTSAEEATPYNDKFITITREELWAAINARNDFTAKMTDLTEALAMCLSEYVNNGAIAADKRMPWPAPITLLDYRLNANYIDEVDRYAGRFPFLVNNSNVETGQAVANIFDSVGCNNLNLTSGNNADLSDDSAEYRQLWENWKDHFFYALSSNFDPKSAAADCVMPCIQVNGVSYAGAVFFGGSRQAGITRNAPPIDADDKNDVSNYLENGNDSVIKVAAGDGTDLYALNATNDIMFCLSDAVPPVVAPC